MRRRSRDSFPLIDFPDEDARFADKLDHEFMIEDYEEMARERDLSLKELFAEIIHEALQET